MNKALSLLALAALAFAAPVLANDDAVATLAAQTGQVSASSGGDFATAVQGQRLQAGDRLMLVEGASAKVRFDNGCTLEFDQPGVYTLPRECVAALATGTDWAGAAKIAAGVAVGAALLDSMDQGTHPPVSR